MEFPIYEVFIVRIMPSSATVLLLRSPSALSAPSLSNVANVRGICEDHSNATRRHRRMDRVSYDLLCLGYVITIQAQIRQKYVP